MFKAALALTLLLVDDLASHLKLAADKDPDRRVQAVESLKTSRDPRALQALLPLLGDPHAKVRYRTLLALRDGPDPLPPLKSALRLPSPLARQSACIALGGSRRKEAAPLLLDRLGDPDPLVQGEAASALGLLGDRSVTERLIDAFHKRSDWPLRASVLEAVGRLAPERLPEILDAAAGAGPYQVRLAAAERGRIDLVGDRDWRVRAAAIDACRARRDREAVGRLIDQFPRETGRLRWDIFTALGDLTGKDLGLNPKSWKAWWDANRETFDPRPRPAQGAPAAGAIGGETQASFFKVPILSTRLLFLLDLSGSMRDPSPEGGTKLDVARRGMTETIGALPADARFGILGLGCAEDGTYALREKKTWQGRPALLPAAPACKADAARFVAGLEAKGWTNLYDGIEYAFTEPDVDTVYLYSDGGASKGIFVASAEILHHLTRMNRFRRIVIHTVEVPGERNPADNRKLLQEIARATGGTCALYERR